VNITMSEICCAQYKKNSVKLMESDFERLEYGKYLNDNLVEFGLYDIFHNTPEKISRTFHLFSTQFYTNLTSTKKNT